LSVYFIYISSIKKSAKVKCTISRTKLQEVERKKKIEKQERKKNKKKEEIRKKNDYKSNS